MNNLRYEDIDEIYDLKKELQYESNLKLRKILISYSLIFASLLGILTYVEIKKLDQKEQTDNNISSDDMLDNTGIYEVGQHSVVTKSTKEELTNIINNIPTWYDLEKIEKLENNEYDVYFINNTKVVVTKDNKFGIEIEDAKVKTK